MHWYALKQLLVYATLLLVGCFFLFVGLGGAFGKAFGALALITGLSFTGVAVYGLVQRKPLKQLHSAAKWTLVIGSISLLAFIVLMSFVVFALRNFT